MIIFFSFCLTKSYNLVSNPDDVQMLSDGQVPVHDFYHSDVANRVSSCSDMLNDDLIV